LPDSIRRLAVAVRGEPTNQSWRRIEPGMPNIALVLPAPEPRDTTATVTIRLAHAFIDGGGLIALLSSFNDLIRSGCHHPRRICCTGESPSSGVRRGRDVRRRSAILRQTASTAVRLDLVDTQRPVVKGEVPACMGTSYALFQLLARFGSGSRLLRASVLLCVAMLAYCGMRGRKGAWVAVNVANRMSADDKAFVGLTIQTVGWCTVSRRGSDRRPGQNRGRPVGGVRPHGRYDPDAATRELERRRFCRDCRTSISTTSSRRIPVAARTGADHRSGARSPQPQVQAGNAAGGRRRLPVRIQCLYRTTVHRPDPEVRRQDVHRADITRFIDFLRYVTVTVAGDPDVPVTDLLVKA